MSEELEKISEQESARALERSHHVQIHCVNMDARSLARFKKELETHYVIRDGSLAWLIKELKEEYKNV